MYCMLHLVYMRWRGCSMLSMLCYSTLGLHLGGRHRTGRPNLPLGLSARGILALPKCSLSVNLSVKVRVTLGPSICTRTPYTYSAARREAPSSTITSSSPSTTPPRQPPAALRQRPQPSLLAALHGPPPRSPDTRRRRGDTRTSSPSPQLIHPHPQLSPSPTVTSHLSPLTSHRQLLSRS